MNPILGAMSVLERQGEVAILRGATDTSGFSNLLSTLKWNALTGIVPEVGVGIVYVLRGRQEREAC